MVYDANEFFCTNSIYNYYGKRPNNICQQPNKPTSHFWSTGNALMGWQSHYGLQAARNRLTNVLDCYEIHGIFILDGSLL